MPSSSLPVYRLHQRSVGGGAGGHQVRRHWHSFASAVFPETGCRKVPLNRLEPCAVKVAGTVLRVRWRSNALLLPD
ncbi:MAG: hypothetical protein NT163_01290 [Chlorobiales bacterium]|nr:hypothetical protein [Chlorobiales bacterium]